MPGVFSRDGQEGSAKRGFHWAWIILSVCFVNLFLNYGIRLGFGVVLPEMISSLGLNRTQAGTIFNIYLAVYICITPLTGNLTDRFGARRVITLFSILLGIGTLLMGMVQSFGQACLVFAVAGAGASAMWTPIVTVVQRWFGLRRRGMALGIVSTGYGLGFAVMGSLFPILVNAFSWRFCWYLLGASVLVMVPVNGVLLRSRPEDLQTTPWGERDVLSERQPMERSTKEGRYGEVLRLARFWTIGVSFLFASFPLYMVTTFMVDYAKVELGFSYKQASFLATIHGLSQVLGVLTIPPLSDRIGRRLTLVSAHIFIALSVLGMIVSAGSPFALYWSIAVFGIFYGAIWPLYSACGGDYFRKEVMGTTIGAWTPFYGFGAISALFVAGRIRDVTLSFQPAFYLAIISALVASFLIMQVKTSPTRA